MTEEEKQQMARLYQARAKRISAVKKKAKKQPAKKPITSRIITQILLWLQLVPGLNWIINFVTTLQNIMNITKKGAKNITSLCWDFLLGWIPGFKLARGLLWKESKQTK